MVSNKLLDFARYIGISVSLDPYFSDDTTSWDGRVLHVGDDDTNAGIAHEIAHWMIAKESNRKKANFGLGERVSPDFRSDREDEAELLADVLLTELGLVGTINYQPDPDSKSEFVTEVLSRLTKRGVLPVHKGRYK